MFVDHLVPYIGALWGFVSVVYIISILIRRNDIADVAWGTGIFLVALISYFSSTPTVLTSTLTVLAGLWGMRLTLRIFLRNRKKSEDYRYKAWRDAWGRWFYIRSYLQIYVFQGFLMIVVGYPFIHAAIYGSEFTARPLFFVGLLVWCVGYVFEVVSDWQLDRFIKQKPPEGEVLRSGLWRYSRHPNYFGEVTMWWGMWLMVATLPMSYRALISPITITFLILKVSGIPMLEKRFAGNPQFEEYKRRTSVFFPLPPKRM